MSRAHSDSESFADDENSSLESETEPDKIALQLAPILTVHSDTHISSDDDRPIPVLTPQRRSPIPQRDSPVPHRNSPVPAVIQNTSIKPQLHIMEKLALCRKFGGYPHENGLVFLREFESFAILHHITPDENERKIAAFHLQLTGPELTWFNSLNSEHKLLWNKFEELFRSNYVQFDWQSPTVMLENENFEQLKLSPGQAIEDFHCQLVEKGQLLNKAPHEILTKFIMGLPEKLALFVRAGGHKDMSSALSAAKLGEAYGYRIADELMVAATNPATKTANKATFEPSLAENLASQIAELTQKVEQLSSQRANRSFSNSDNWKPRRTDKNIRTRDTTSNFSYTAPQQNKLTCHKCRGQKHFIRNCNWNGKGQSNPDIQCQLWSQFGHIVSKCIQLTNTGNRTHPRDTRHDPSGDRF